MTLSYRLSIGALCVWCVWINLEVNAYKPCAARDYGGESIVCVCNETYCDEIVREQANLGCYVYYTSSKGGLRFAKKTGSFSSSSTKYGVKLEVWPEECFQKIKGFGSSATDAAGLNWRNLPSGVRQKMIDSYFSKKGLEYNIIRTPIGGCDFSTRVYTYCDFPEGDIKLSNFSLAYEDYLYKIPMIKAALKASCRKIDVLASCWSPPVWMKTNKAITGRGFLLPECYQAYADYHLKYIEEYVNEGICIWGITTTNEPINGLGRNIPFNSLGWTPETFGKWISKNLGPTLRKSLYDVKILCCDDQRYNIPVFFNKMIEYYPESLDYVDGVAFHWYGNGLSPASLFKFVTNNYAEKFLLSTEACEGWQDNKVSLGSWARAQTYCSDILTDLNYNVAGWIDWNMCLDDVGGPNWVGNTVDSPIIVLKDQKEFVKQPMYYTMGHFSKWIPRDSVRVSVEQKQCKFLEQTAFRTPEENIVIVMQNLKTEPLCVTITVGKKVADIELEASSITTVEFPFDNRYFGVRRGYVRPPPPPKKPRGKSYSRPSSYTNCLIEQVLDMYENIVSTVHNLEDRPKPPQ